MENRGYFQFFCDDAPHHFDEPEIYTFFIEKGDDFFVGKELYVNDLKVTFYFYPTGDNQALLCLYLNDNDFDELVDNLDENNAEEIAGIWPMMMQALDWGINDNYYNKALIKLNTNHFAFWTLCTMVENIDFGDLDTEYISNKLLDLYQYAVAMLEQMDNNELSTWDHISIAGKNFIDGIKQADVFSNIVDLFTDDDD